MSEQLNRRGFLGQVGRTAIGLAGLPALMNLSCASVQTGGTAGGPAPVEVTEDVFAFTDSCTGYLIRSGKRGILIDPGQGGIAAHLAELGVKQIDWILHTHAHRDLCGGDAALLAQGAKLAVPEGTRDYFAAAGAHWLETPTYYGYLYGPKFFLPLRDLPVERTLKGGETFEWRGVRLGVLATPGHTEDAISLVLERDGKKLVFSGDVIHSAGRVWEMDSLQTIYEEFNKTGNELRRVPELRQSIAALRAEAPDLLLPAHGAPFGDCDAALAALDANIGRMMKTLEITTNFSKQAEVPELRMYQTAACHYLLMGADGHAMLFDAGFDEWMQGKRQFIKWIKEQDDLKQVDIFVPSHLHNDHIASVRAFVDHYGTKVYAHEVLREPMEAPARFFFPCLQYYPIKVDRTFRDGESFEWNGWKFTIYYFPGQTYWHQATLAEVDGKRILFTGDSIDGLDHVRNIDCWNRNPISDTEGAMICLKVLQATRPDYLATGHWGIQKWDPAHLISMRRYITERNAILTELIAQEDANMGYDVRWAEADPFRTVLKEGQREFPLTARVHNYLDRDAKAVVRLTLPDGWSARPAEVSADIAPGADGALEFMVAAPAGAAATRHLIGLDATLGGTAYGELGMAFVDIGQDHSIERRTPEKFVGNSADYGFF